MVFRVDYINKISVVWRYQIWCLFLKFHYTCSLLNKYFTCEFFIYLHLILHHLHKVDFIYFLTLLWIKGIKGDLEDRRMGYFLFSIFTFILLFHRFLEFKYFPVGKKCKLVNMSTHANVYQYSILWFIIFYW